MRGIIKSGQLIELVPSEFEKVKVDDVILVKLQDNCLLNKVIEIGQNKLLIGNKRLKTQKWVKKESVIAKVAQVFN